MPVVEFVGQSARDQDNITADPSRLVNLYRERAGTGTAWLKSVPGEERIATLPDLFITAMGNVLGELYVVCNARLYRVAQDGSFYDLGAVAGGDATIAGNNGYVCVQAGQRYFTYEISTGTLTEPAAGAFSAFGSCDFVDNYTVLTEAGGRLFQWSNLADPTDLPGLNFASAEGRDDNLVRAFGLHGQLYLFKERSHEIWFNTGGAGAEAFLRVTGGVKDVGLLGHGLICRFPGGAFMVGSDNRAHLVGPGVLQPVSTPAVETAIKLGKPVCCVNYEDEGHTFCAIVFRDQPAWVYDIATGEWHERASGADLSPWRAAASARLGTDWVIGNDAGEVLALRRSNVDAAGPLVREATSRTLYLDGARPILRELEFFVRQGFSAAEILLSVSRDGGITWTPWKQRPISEQGEYGRRVIWRQLGQARQVTVKVRVTDALEAPLSSQARITL